jgi:AcrR family transcriptional regulator
VECPFPRLGDTAPGRARRRAYHQFRTKDEILIALAARELARLEDALEEAEAEQCRPRAR